MTSLCSPRPASEEGPGWGTYRNRDTWRECGDIQYAPIIQPFFPRKAGGKKGPGFVHGTSSIEGHERMNNERAKVHRSDRGAPAMARKFGAELALSPRHATAYLLAVVFAERSRSSDVNHCSIFVINRAVCTAVSIPV